MLGYHYRGMEEKCIKGKFVEEGDVDREESRGKLFYIDLGKNVIIGGGSKI